MPRESGASKQTPNCEYWINPPSRVMTARCDALANAAAPVLSNAAAGRGQFRAGERISKTNSTDRTGNGERCGDLRLFA
jgi:hypothetical protein